MTGLSLLLLAIGAALWGFASACAWAARRYGGDSFWIGIGIPAAVLSPVLALVGAVGFVGSLL